MTIFKEIALLTLRCIKICLRNPVFLFMGVATPVIHLAFFTPLLKTLASNGTLGTDNVLTLFIPGMLPIIAFSTGLFTGFGMIDEVRSGLLERFRVTPARRFSILSGPVLFDTCSVFFSVSSFYRCRTPIWISCKPAWSSRPIRAFSAPRDHHLVFWECDGSHLKK